MTGAIDRFRRFLESAVSTWSQVFRLLRYSSPRLSFIVVILTALEAFISVFILYLVKLLIDGLTNELGGDVALTDTFTIYLYLMVGASALLLGVIVQTGAALTRTAQGFHVSDHVDKEIHARAIAVDLEFYESPAYFDSLERARAGGGQRPAMVISNTLLALKSAFVLVGIMLMIAGIEWRILPALAVAICAIFAIRIAFIRTFFHWQRSRVQMERRASYLDWLMTSDHHAKELRLGELGSYLSQLYSGLRTKIRGEHFQIEKRKALAELIVSALGSAIFVGVSIYLLNRALDGSLSVGDLVLFVLLFRRAETAGRELARHLSRLYDDQLYLGQLFAFLTVEPKIKRPAQPADIPIKPKEGLICEAVDFQYPNSPEVALSDINFALGPGEVVSLVGENGSGKTSLIKVLTRLYDPTKGKVTLDGIDIQSFDPIDYRRLFSVIFQDYSKYAATALDNIRFGNIHRELRLEEIKKAAQRAEAYEFLSKLERGFETPLTRMFDDGRELSLGQWQRVALARALYPPSKFIIMDEPTSAMDPRAEANLFETFRERIGDRGALIISHRLSTVRLTDRTYFLKNGRIVECGSHKELLALQGEYATMFERQLKLGLAL